jgi:hypothetical protein
VRLSGGGIALGFPLGPKIFTSAREVFKAQIHLFRRFAAVIRDNQLACHSTEQDALTFQSTLLPITFILDVSR